MSYTEEQLTAIQRSKASGAKSVRNANGEQVEYRPLSELDQIESGIKRQLSGKSRVTHVNPVHDRGL